MIELVMTTLVWVFLFFFLTEQPSRINEYHHWVEWACGLKEQFQKVMILAIEVSLLLQCLLFFFFLKCGTFLKINGDNLIQNPFCLTHYLLWIRLVKKNNSFYSFRKTQLIRNNRLNQVSAPFKSFFWSFTATGPVSSVVVDTRQADRFPV